VSRALEAALEKNLIHRDIKPDNIILAAKGMVKVADFGLARDLGSALRITAPGAVVGTPAFMSPEQGLGEELDHRSDLYSLGATLYYTLTGKVPYSSDQPARIIHMHVNDPVPDPRAAGPRVSEAVARIVMRLMAKKPGGRYQTAASLIADLERLRAGPAAAPASPSALSAAGATMSVSGVREPAAAPAVEPAAPKPRDAPTLDVPAEVFEDRGVEAGRFRMETVDGEEEGAGLAFSLLPVPRRSGGLDAAVLVGRGCDPAPKRFLFSKEVVRFGRQAEAEDPEEGRVRVDLVLRLLPCRSEKEDPENYRKNLTISRLQGSFRIREREVLLAGARGGKGLALDGAPVHAGGAAALPDRCAVSLSRGALALQVRLFREKAAGAFTIRGEPGAAAPAGIVGMENSGRIAAVRIERPANAPSHAYVILARWGAIGEGEADAIRFAEAGAGARIYWFRQEYFLGSAGGKVTMDGRAVPDGTLAPLSPGAVIRAGGAEIEFRVPKEDDFKRV
jgi:hypothetical protein